MPNIGALLKHEISRLCRKEIRMQTAPLRKASAAYRREIASLKRQISTLERRTKVLARTAKKGLHASEEASGLHVRFVAKGLRSMRKRLGLSAPQLARLVGVSTQSIYNWETKKATPRAEQLQKVIELRSVGKRGLAEQLNRVSSAGKRSKPRRRKP